METKRSFAFFILITILGIFLLSTLANMYFWYWKYPHFDKLMHFLGGMFVGSMGLYIYYVSTYITPRHFSIASQLCIAVGFLSFVGILWEFFEYVLYAGFAKETLAAQLYLEQGLADALGDLLADLSGSVFATGIYSLIWKKKS